INKKTKQHLLHHVKDKNIIDFSKLILDTKNSEAIFNNLFNELIEIKPELGKRIKESFESSTPIDAEGVTRAKEEFARHISNPNTIKAILYFDQVIKEIIELTLNKNSRERKSHTFEAEAGAFLAKIKTIKDEINKKSSKVNLETIHNELLKEFPLFKDTLLLTHHHCRQYEDLQSERGILKTFFYCLEEYAFSNIMSKSNDFPFKNADILRGLLQHGPKIGDLIAMIQNSIKNSKNNDFDFKEILFFLNVKVNHFNEEVQRLLQQIIRDTKSFLFLNQSSFSLSRNAFDNSLEKDPGESKAHLAKSIKKVYCISNAGQMGKLLTKPVVIDFLESAMNENFQRINNDLVEYKEMTPSLLAQIINKKLLQVSIVNKDNQKELGEAIAFNSAEDNLEKQLSPASLSIKKNIQELMTRREERPPDIAVLNFTSPFCDQTYNEEDMQKIFIKEKKEKLKIITEQLNRFLEVAKSTFYETTLQQIYLKFLASRKEGSSKLKKINTEVEIMEKGDLATEYIHLHKNMKESHSKEWAVIFKDFYQWIIKLKKETIIKKDKSSLNDLLKFDFPIGIEEKTSMIQMLSLIKLWKKDIKKAVKRQQ
ncbi:hypothetical protein HON22_00140, partial [Candidatus Peregrinibacteria bacterium]|nr:hypothetical protein [Candidatus Peregrinibacteria bacterium]